MRFSSIIPKVKSIVNINSLYLYYFASAKTTKLLLQLKEQLRNGSISNKNNHSKLIQLFKQDTNELQSRYGSYHEIKQLFEGYLSQMGNEKNISVYNPALIQEQGNRLSELMSHISTYPKFQLDKEYLRLAYLIFCRQLQHRTSQELNRALLFTLKTDRKAEQSVIYRQFLKFYLRQQWQTLKAKYQLSLRNQSIGSFISKMVSSILHRGFFRRSPNYDKQLKVFYPCQVMEGLLQNQSTSDSLMIRKVIYCQIFTPLVNQYQNQLRQNLYHQKNPLLWQQLNKYCNIIFHTNKYLEKQCQYLRQLYLTLFLVLRQQNKIALLLEYLQQIVYADYYMKKYYSESNKVKQFSNSLTQFVIKQIKDNKQNQEKIIQCLKLTKYTFILVEQIPQITIQVMDKIAKQISYLTFSVYFDGFMELMGNWTELFVRKISGNSEGNFFREIASERCLEVVEKMMVCGNLGVGKQQIYNRIVQAIIDKDYKCQPQLSEVLIFLSIYSLHQQLSIPTKDQGSLQTFRIFLFRFISDNIQKTNTQQLQSIITVLIKLNDERYFGDGQGNYELNIFEEVGEVILNSSVEQRFKDIIKEKLREPTKEVQDNGANDRNQYIKNMIKKIIK